MAVIKRPSAAVEALKGVVMPVPMSSSLSDRGSRGRVLSQNGPFREPIVDIIFTANQPLTMGKERTISPLLTVIWNTSFGLQIQERRTRHERVPM
ncbi:hypothetical protein AVEN_127621-1 [Araneus ventricosus]|uniref:Uncharacterized protein n=1 Tax=Araneus ventricosus TaxID=182803 RepID=A0A4Y2QFX3_ARAVE|nr:hypothetical protein AVEN_127621-1 [Araneus ventricosus]